MVAEDAAGRLTYQPSAPQRPPYRAIRAKARLQPSPPGASAVRHGHPDSTVRIEQYSLEVEEDGSYLTRHPLLGAYDRLLRLEVEGATAAKAGDDREAAWGRLAPLLVEGLVFAGRKYIVCEADTWPQMCHPIKEAWPLLGAAVALPTVQGMAARAELWASKAVPLALHGWTVRYEPDRTATDPCTGATIKLTDGAGRASLDLWAHLPAAWAAHRDAARAAAGERDFRELLLRGGGGRPPPVTTAAVQLPYNGGQVQYMPVQMRLHHGLLASRPRVIAKGMLSPDASLPYRTIVLPYSCVKAPAREVLERWVILEGALGDGRDAEEDGAGGAGEGQGQQGAAAGGSEADARVSRRGYTACVQLELVNCGRAVGESRLNQNLLPLLVHHGLPREFVYRLFEVALKEVRGATQTPATTFAALRSLGGRFSPLWQRLAAGWGYTDLNAWQQPDAHLQRELKE
ncbi:hypothetical protein TSOC_005560 [Tetrabaena socialis]|uniref:Uncharacterized protein n=1 Tax=Tetrabaena socialis TaxID=47790 RepID=A0A2J8A613_9CHLO|nr:hypothetical protein TSOC_005560 [Tetrabaena socialis]|eukprot:PNH07940.1 hypothetical protein TSOC_005560 [Tetrabaena socialis]